MADRQKPTIVRNDVNVPAGDISLSVGQEPIGTKISGNLLTPGPEESARLRKLAHTIPAAINDLIARKFEANKNNPARQLVDGDIKAVLSGPPIPNLGEMELTQDLGASRRLPPIIKDRRSPPEEEKADRERIINEIKDRKK
mgnify:CR=1 FL=1